MTHVTDEELIAAYIENKGVTICPPAAAKGAELSRQDKKGIATLCREFRKEQNYIPNKFDKVMPDGRILAGYYDV